VSEKPRSESLKGLGPKYGATVRKRYSQILRLLRRRRECPACGKWSLKRSAAGIWSCERCGHRFAGGAYQP
jgi:large subunit ribosomal protein L37Ae